MKAAILLNLSTLTAQYLQNGTDFRQLALTRQLKIRAKIFTKSCSVFQPYAKGTLTQLILLQDPDFLYWPPNGEQKLKLTKKTLIFGIE